MELLSIPVAQWPPQNHDPRRLKMFIHPEVLVQVFDEGNGLYRLTVNLLALGGNGRWKDGISWDRLQEIKDAVGFAGQDAVEVYPAAQDVVNVANMRHLWVLPEKLPFAWRHKP